MATLWKRFFKRSDALSEAIERAVEAQVRFESGHPVPYAVDQRVKALTIRAERHFGSKLPDSARELIRVAATEWEAASKAAKEV